MKRIFVLLLCLIPVYCAAQKLPDFGLNRIRIAQADKIIQAEIDPVSSDPSLKSNLFYYWYSANAIHITQGGFSGKLLNGVYTEYYLDKNLKAQGSFKKGLKQGVWKTWNADGTLANTSTWKNGVDVSGNHRSIWRKLNILKKERPARDTVVNKANK